jgi:hypothetical protein
MARTVINVTISAVAPLCRGSDSAQRVAGELGPIDKRTVRLVDLKGIK